MKSNTKKYGVDLIIVGLFVLIVYGILGVFYMLLKIDIGALPILVQTLIGALFQFGLMGLGIVVICVRNKESFLNFGLKKEKLILTIILSILVCLPSLIFQIFTNKNLSYFPLQNVNFTKPVLAAGFSINIVGMIIIIVTWGFFEGFSYVVISDHINKLLSPKSLLINWGAIICGIFCLVIHVLLGQSYSFWGTITEFVLIYGMLVVYHYTGNAWGCVLIFLLFWSGVGY